MFYLLILLFVSSLSLSVSLSLLLWLVFLFPSLSLSLQPQDYLRTTSFFRPTPESLHRVHLLAVQAETPTAQHEMFEVDPPKVARANQQLYLTNATSYKDIHFSDQRVY